jgi:hypothetical protein
MDEAQASRESTGELMSFILYSLLTASSAFKARITAQLTGSLGTLIDQSLLILLKMNLRRSGSGPQTTQLGASVFMYGTATTHQKSVQPAVCLSRIDQIFPISWGF